MAGCAGRPPPEGVGGKVGYISTLLLNPWIITSITATFFAGVAWMLAMTKFELSYAFPFVSLNYVLVFLAGHFLFGEAFTSTKMIGSALIILGLVVIARG